MCGSGLCRTREFEGTRPAVFVKVCGTDAGMAVSSVVGRVANQGQEVIQLVDIRL